METTADVDGLPQEALWLVKSISWILKYIYPTKYQEMEGIVEAINEPNFTIDHVLIMNVYTEMLAFCTSIVAQQADGKIIMGRNIDGWDVQDVLAPLTYKARFLRDGIYQYDAIIFHGSVGVFTASKEGAFSIAANQRNNEGFEEDYN